MGNAPGKWITPTGMKKDGSTLVELEIPRIGDAHEVIGIIPESFTPVTLLPLSSRSKICGAPCCCVSIPAGFSAIVTRFGKDVDGDDGQDGSWSPGFHCFWPWNSVSRLVSRQLVVFDAPVRMCKTKDNVTVQIDLLMVFDITNARDFCYKLGPGNLDSLLRASQEEVMRSCTSEIEVDKIFDLFGDTHTEKWVDVLNKKLVQYGVCVRSLTITNVKLPHKMTENFEEQTLFASKTLEKEMIQTSGLLTMENDEELQKLREECDNKRMWSEEQAVTTKAQISKEVREVVANTEKTLLMEEAQRNADGMDIKVTTELELAKIEAEINSLKRISKAQLEMEVGKLTCESDAYDKKRRAHAISEAAEKLAEGRKLQVEAEGDAVDAFGAKRELEQELARLLILDKMASNMKMNVVTTRENDTGLAPNNSLLSQIANQGMEAMRMKLAEVTSGSAKKLNMGTLVAGGLVRPVPPQEVMR